MAPGWRAPCARTLRDVKSTTDDIERSFLIAERAMELMKAYGSSAAPRSYEVWYTYVGGQKPLMNDAIKRLSVERGNISDEDITAIYDAHLATHRHIVEAEKTSASVIAEIDEVMDMIGLALGSTAKYGQSLAALSNDLAGPIDRSKVRDVIASIVNATKASPRPTRPSTRG